MRKILCEPFCFFFCFFRRVLLLQRTHPLPDVFLRTTCQFVVIPQLPQIQYRERQRELFDIVFHHAHF